MSSVLKEDNKKKNAIDTSDQLYVSVCQMFATRYRM